MSTLKILHSSKYLQFRRAFFFCFFNLNVDLCVTECGPSPMHMSGAHWIYLIISYHRASFRKCPVQILALKTEYFFTCCPQFIRAYTEIYRVSQEECARLRESVPYVKVYRYNPKHLYPNLNGYGDNAQRKVGASCGSKYCNLQS